MNGNVRNRIAVAGAILAAVLCGTGTATPDPDRAEARTAIVAGRLVDTKNTPTTR